MPNILIVFGSTTGNTEQAANIIDGYIQEAGHEAELSNVAEVTAKGLCTGRDLVLFGCSTWGQEEIELQDDFAAFFDHFDKLEARGVRTAVFGCGEKGYPHFCGAVDVINDRLLELGADIVCAPLKIDGEPGDSDAEIKNWVGNILQALA